MDPGKRRLRHIEVPINLRKPNEVDEESTSRTLQRRLLEIGGIDLNNSLEGSVEDDFVDFDNLSEASEDLS
jgi:hypothetical protein